MAMMAPLQNARDIGTFLMELRILALDEEPRGREGQAPPRGGLMASLSIVGPVARKPIETSDEFQARFPIKGRVLWTVMCDHCEAEGELRIRMARDPTKGWDYRLDDKASFVDVHAVDAAKVYDKARAGEWGAGQLIVLGAASEG